MNKLEKQQKAIWIKPSTFFLYKSFKSAIEAGLARAISNDDLVTKMIQVIQQHDLMKQIVLELRVEKNES